MPIESLSPVVESDSTQTLKPDQVWHRTRDDIEGNPFTITTEIYNRSGIPTEVLVQGNYIPDDLMAKKIIFMPDINPTQTSRLPTGVCVEIDSAFQSSWRKFAISDVGCGMQVVKSELTWDDFERDLGKWDELYMRLAGIPAGEQGTLGSGNHFIDAAVDEEEKVYFVIHTGSRLESEKAEDLVDKPFLFDKTYFDITKWARGNRDAIRHVIEKVYGETTKVTDKTHNFYNYDPDTQKVVIYKGTVCMRDEQLTLIPSSMDGQMALVKRKRDFPEINNAMAHGTGRTKSRGEIKEELKDYDVEGLRSRIYIPDMIEDASLKSNIPPAYRSLDECLEMVGDIVDVVKRLTPIAYNGHIRPIASNS